MQLGLLILFYNLTFFLAKSPKAKPSSQQEKKLVCSEESSQGREVKISGSNLTILITDRALSKKEKAGNKKLNYKILSTEKDVLIKGGCNRIYSRRQSGTLKVQGKGNKIAVHRKNNKIKISGHSNLLKTSGSGHDIVLKELSRSIIFVNSHRTKITNFGTNNKIQASSSLLFLINCRKTKETELFIEKESQLFYIDLGTNNTVYGESLKKSNLSVSGPRAVLNLFYVTTSKISVWGDYAKITLFGRHNHENWISLHGKKHNSVLVTRKSTLKVLGNESSYFLSGEHNSFQLEGNNTKTDILGLNNTILLSGRKNNTRIELGQNTVKTLKNSTKNKVRIGGTRNKADISGRYNKIYIQRCQNKIVVRNKTNRIYNY